MVVLLRSSPSVSQLAPGSPQDLHFYSCDLIQRDESENWLWHMHDKYSAPLRSLFLFARTQNKYNEFINAEVDKLSLERLINILRYASESTDTSHLVISTEPSPTDRTSPERSIISKYVLEKICKVVLKDRVEKLRQLYDSLQDEPAMSTTAGMVFEFWVISAPSGGEDP